MKFKELIDVLDTSTASTDRNKANLDIYINTLKDDFLQISIEQVNWLCSDKLLNSQVTEWFLPDESSKTITIYLN